MTTEEKIKAIAAFVGLGGLIFGIVQFFQVQAIEAAQPFLTKKLEWCEEAVEKTSKIATTEPPDPTDLQRFAQMYWGVMGLIENRDIIEAMKAFDEGLTNQVPAYAGPKLEGSEVLTLTELSLDLAEACRAELSAEWSSRWARR